MNKKLLVTGTIFGVLGIILGAFASHGLKGLITAEALQSFETGVRYQMYHAFLLLILGGTSILKEKPKKAVYFLIVVGLLFFSGSIYGLSTHELTALNFKSIALMTPIGGFLLIIAWLILLINLLKMKGDN